MGGLMTWDGTAEPVPSANGDRANFMFPKFS